MNVFHSFSIRSLLAVALFLFVGGQVSAQPYMPDRTSDDERMQWFADAKLGIFIHWGIYAVNGIDESWSFFNGLIGHDDYMKQLDGFTASSYDPNAWVRLIRESGAPDRLSRKNSAGAMPWLSGEHSTNFSRSAVGME